MPQNVFVAGETAGEFSSIVACCGIALPSQGQFIKIPINSAKNRFYKSHVFLMCPPCVEQLCRKTRLVASAADVVAPCAAKKISDIMIGSITITTITNSIVIIIMFIINSIVIIISSSSRMISIRLIIVIVIITLR